MSKNPNDYCKVQTKEILNNLDTEIPSHYGYGVRHVQFGIFFICMAVTFIARGHLGVTIVAMTNIPHKNISSKLILNKTIEVNDNLTVRKDNYNVSRNIETADDFNNLGEDDNELKFAVYDWDKKTQEMVLGSFFTGYSVGMVPTGLLSQRWGAKIPLQACLLINGLISIASPWLITWGGWKAICGCRVLQGLFQAGTYPGIQLLIANWAPLSERGAFTSYLYGGTILGTVIAFQISGLLANTRWGWPSTFWAVGFVCLVCLIVVTIFGAACPNDHKSISEEEKKYIIGDVKDKNTKGSKKLPWKAIITSKHVWATYATNITSGSMFVFLFTQVASYIHYILGINVSDSGLLSSLPYIVSLFSSVCFGVLADYCTNKNIVSRKNARRIVNSISQFGVSITLMMVTIAPNTAWAITFFVIALSCHMGVHTGWMLNQIDLAPNYTGIVMTMGNVITAFVVQLVPILNSYILVDMSNITQWRIVFGVMAGWALLGNTIFVLLLSADNQPWNDYIDVPTDEEKIDHEIGIKKNEKEMLE